MTNGETPITADNGLAPNTAPAQQNAAAAMAAPQQAATTRFAEPEQPALSAAAFELSEAVEAEAAPQTAEVEAPVDADIDLAKKKEDEDEDADGELVDLAMTPTADVLDAIAAADGAREVSGDEAEASALGGDGSGSGVVLGVLAVAAVGAGLYLALDGGDDDEPFQPAPPPANVAPVFTSAAAVAIDENSPVDTTVVDLNATDADNDAITFSILSTSTDAAAFTVDPATGVVRFVASPDFETKASFTFTAVATDAQGNATQQVVTVTINDVNEVIVNQAPTFTSLAVADIDENSDATTVVLDADATDPEGDVVTFSILDNNSDTDTDNDDDGDLFSIDPATGEVRFVASPDFEAQETYTLTIVATDSEGNATQQDVTVTVNDVDDDVVTVNLDTADNDSNPLTANIVDADGDDFNFTDDDGIASNTIIRNFEEGDTITFSEGSVLSYTTGADDPNDLEISVNVNGVVSIIVLDDVLADDAGFIFNESTAEAAVGFDFISVDDPATTTVANETFA